MTAPDPSAVAHVAGLARLKFSDEELRLFQQEFAAILEMVEVLEELPAVEGVDTDSSAPTPMRPDAVTNANLPDAMLANAPDREGYHFRVPAVLGGED
ncbi:MAG: Asp-tRNA(Asn)/Glu-tRNA(Gln) amidotransferase GatCAB subunit C [Deltaproteobacteria bacterium]|nr:Asp-tRNA(Asn)/Glu-tRNA(Gln) amidotransferase GatCAB subunit C [Deltaproteobacteria bacterium]